MNTIRLFLVDDEPVVLRGLQLLLSRHPDLEIVGFADSMAKALELMPPLKPDIAIVDLALRDGDGFQVLARMRAQCPQTRLLVFSMHREEAFVQAALTAGASAYVTKDQGTEKLLDTVLSLVAGFPKNPAVGTTRDETARPAPREIN